MKFLIIITLFFMFNCSDNTSNVTNNSEYNSEKILSNNISKLTISGDSLYIFTDLGYSLVPNILIPENLSSYKNDIYNGFVIYYLKGVSNIYNSFTSITDQTFNIKTFKTGVLNDEFNHQWFVNNQNFNVILEMAEKGDEILCARQVSGLAIIKNGKFYISLIDTIKGNIQKYPYSEVTDTNSIFFIKNFKDSVVTIPKNDINGIKIFNDQIIAQTWDGIYTSIDGDIWHKNKFMENRAKECIESSQGVVDGKNIFYAYYQNKINMPQWDTLYTGDMTNDGLYVSNDNLKTFTYISKFKGKTLSAMNSQGDKIIIATSDSIFTGIYRNLSFKWQAIAINSTMAKHINSVAVTNSQYFLGSENVGVLYSNDFTNWNYITKDKEVALDLKEIYAYPTTITTKTPIVRFAYSLSKNNYVTIKIYDYNGDLVKTVINNQLRKAGTVTSKSADFNIDIWDGKDNKNRTVNPGTYDFNITTKNGNLSAWGKVVVGVIQ